MNGIDTLKEVMRRHPLPVIVVSSHSTEGASITLKALALGAFDFVAKPHDATLHMAEAARELIAKIKVAAECKVVRPGWLGAAPRGEVRERKIWPPPTTRDRYFHRRAAGARIPAGATSCRLSRNNCSRPTHAGRVH